MLIEELLLIGLGFIFVFLIGLPLYKIARLIYPVKKDPIKEAKIRFEVAEQEFEAAKLNKKTEKIYNDLYEDVLNEGIKERKADE